MVSVKLLALPLAMIMQSITPSSLYIIAIKKQMEKKIKPKGCNDVFEMCHSHR